MKAKSEDEPGMGGMGIVNTVMRLQIFFEGRFDFEIQDKVSGGETVVYLRVHLPGR